MTTDDLAQLDDLLRADPVLPPPTVTCAGDVAQRDQILADLERAFEAWYLESRRATL